MSPVKKSYLRHLGGAMLAACLGVLIAHPEWLAFLGAAGAAVVVAVLPVVVKALDSSEPDFGLGAIPQGPAPTTITFQPGVGNGPTITSTGGEPTGEPPAEGD